MPAAGAPARRHRPADAPRARTARCPGAGGGRPGAGASGRGLGRPGGPPGRGRGRRGDAAAVGAGRRPRRRARRAASAPAVPPVSHASRVRAPIPLSQAPRTPPASAGVPSRP
ncbi:MAG: hypothetical protein DCC50_10140 [Acidobacteria bacterium]|nr:MAG: hypothetical protein DCC50_10140 [Acidobacteriota bacterium]